MVNTRSRISAAGSSTSRVPIRNLDSVSDDLSGSEADGEDVFQDISKYLEGMKKSVAKAKKELTDLRNKKKELEEELEEEKEAANIASSTRRRAVKTPERIAKLEDEVKELKRENRKKDRIVRKMKEKELKQEAEDLKDDLPDPDDAGIDDYARMRKLLRAFSDLMYAPTLGPDDECAIAVDCEGKMELKKCSAFNECGHIFCDDCWKRILPKDEMFRCPICRKCTHREDMKMVTMTEVGRWDKLLDVAKAWDAFDHRREVDTSEEEAEEDFITDNSGDEATSLEPNDDEAEPDGENGRQSDDQEERSERASTPSTPPPRLPYAVSPMKEKRKRLAELAEEREKKKRR